ncbi:MULTISPECIES: GIN domain-containing protein [Robiginitalea]|uniref:GIN domain-containing protein n=1 Tax=Robiginitalea TaxID=252306 RepID=UPI00234B2485|nr:MULTISPECIES: DUF2807 domain-containing protein [unclassified Robiginitalea]MDC6354428.1 DUF2807 domain-containing protein [Robiginitalea sp. PM2]MDC6374890.1 DUF2807 domain-containing protein [Robiginitalea sp. SP8]
MKRIEKIRALALVLALLVGAGAWAQRKPRIKGNRNPVEITESLPPFKYLRLEDDLEVRIRQQGSGGYELRVDDNLVDVLQFQVQDSTLVISSFYDITGSRALDITVFFRELSGVEVLAGKLIGEAEFNADLFSIRTEGAAGAELRLRASLCDVTLAGNSRADLNIGAESLVVRMAERSDATIYTDSDTISAELGDNADLTLEGIGDHAVLRLSGESGLSARKLVAGILEANLSGATTARIHAGTSLILDASGQSRTYLYGEPAVTLRRFADRAELHKEPD